jgi:hypothetical protein
MQHSSRVVGLMKGKSLQDDLLHLTVGKCKQATGFVELCFAESSRGALFC